MRTILILTVASLSLPGYALSQDMALDLARYAANEGGLVPRTGRPNPRGDLLVIWQSAESHGETVPEQYRWMRRHSRCVVAFDPPVLPWGVCRWTRQLRRDGRRPRGIAPDVWDILLPHWRKMLELADNVITGREERRPCLIAPQSWESRRLFRTRVRQGFIPAQCIDPFTGRPTGNEGFRYPGVS